MKARNRTKRHLNKLFSEKGVKYLEHELYTPNQVWFKDIHVDRSVITLICRLRSGHSNTRKMLFRFGLSETPLCPCGEAIENTHHIFFTCSLYTEARVQMFAKIQKLNTPFPPLNIYQFLSKPSVPIIYAIKHFLDKTGLRI